MLLDTMNPADRDPPGHAPLPFATVAHRGGGPLIENPFVKQSWTRRDLVLACVLAQLSSGRSGEDAVGRARATADLLMAEPG